MNVLEAAGGDLTSFTNALAPLDGYQQQTISACLPNEGLKQFTNSVLALIPISHKFEDWATANGPGMFTNVVTRQPSPHFGSDSLSRFSEYPKTLTGLLIDWDAATIDDFDQVFQEFARLAAEPVYGEARGVKIQQYLETYIDSVRICLYELHSHLQNKEGTPTSVQGTHIPNSLKTIADKLSEWENVWGAGTDQRVNVIARAQKMKDHVGSFAQCARVFTGNG